MKNFFALLLAGMIGGAATIGGAKYLENKEQPESTVQQDAVPKQVSSTYAGPQVPFDFVEAASKSLDAVVHIKAAESNMQAYQRAREQRRYDPWGFFMDNTPIKGSGSGVIISKDGYIVTNNHVVDFADKLEVTLHDNRTYKGYKVGTLPESDLAVIKIEADNLVPIVYGNSDDVKVGEWVLAVGNPFDLTSTVTAGIVSAKGRDLQIGSEEQTKKKDYIQTDAAVNPGNSGGALVNVKGELIGINTAIASPTGTYAGYAFAIPVNTMKPIIESIIKNKQNYLPTPTLGIQAANVEDISAQAKEDYGITAKTGVVLLELFDGGSAQYAGLLPNDVISRINSKQVRNISDLKSILTNSKLNDVLMIDVNRNGTYKQVKVKLRE
ncbi:MAG TPA: trypsin-like peptidase domain-containing protein [Saprospiraceae bacterium]|nr:trypsin-like peptidase domain-containing protein [Saprospiraceae bacterium]